MAGQSVTSDLQDWWLVTYQKGEDNRWALFNEKASAQYLYNRLGGGGGGRFIQAVTPAEVARWLSVLTA